LANTLIHLKRYDEARQEVERALECKQPYGHALEPWKTWSILEKLERATNHAEAAQAARSKAVGTYLAYRRAGGVSHSPIADLYPMVRQAASSSDTSGARRLLNEISSDPEIPAYLKPVLPKLMAILEGDRSLAHSADLELDYDDAAELQLLLESLPPT